MCGIAGVVGRPDQEAAQRMVSAMHHRGPDDRGVYGDEHVTLGMTRLSILDLSPAGHQPMSAADGRYWIVYNGEMYNFRRERTFLERKGHSFHSSSDTEVVLHLYQEYGDDCVYHMRGMFAFAIWDSRTSRLFAARDHLGIKPFLFHHQNGRFVFASELKALLASGLIDREIDPHSLRVLLATGVVHPPRTLLKNVHALLPGHSLVLSENRLVINRYWDVAENENEQFRGSFDDAAEELKKLLTESVQEQLISDVPLGAFLSGGLDSAAIVGIASSVTNSHVKTFSIGFDSMGRSIDESSDALKAAQFFSTDHHTIVITDREVDDAFERFVRGLDQPSVDGLNSYFVSRFASQFVKVALSGLGGDEMLLGYGHSRRIVREQSRPSFTRKIICKTVDVAQQTHVWNGMPLRLRRRMQFEADKTDLVRSYSLSRTVFLPDDIPSLMRERTEGSFHPSECFVPFDRSSLDPTKRVSKLDLSAFMGAQLLRDTDAVGMSHSLEVRFPLIDHRIVEFVFDLSADFKLGRWMAMGNNSPTAASYRDGDVKRLLYKAVYSNLPHHLHSRNKTGFHLPFENWLKGTLKERVENALLTPHPSNPLSKRTLDETYRRHIGGRASWTQVWLLTVIDQWCRSVLDSAAA